MGGSAHVTFLHASMVHTALTLVCLILASAVRAAVNSFNNNSSNALIARLSKVLVNKIGVRFRVHGPGEINNGIGHVIGLLY